MTVNLIPIKKIYIHLFSIWSFFLLLLFFFYFFFNETEACITDKCQFLNLNFNIFLKQSFEKHSKSRRKFINLTSKINISPHNKSKEKDLQKWMQSSMWRKLIYFETKRCFAALWNNSINNSPAANSWKKTFSKYSGDLFSS